ncbi:hypothetical protein [Undibacterium sp. RuRC25W]
MHFAYLVNGLPEIYPQISLGQDGNHVEKEEHPFRRLMKRLVAYRLFKGA